MPKIALPSLALAAAAVAAVAQTTPKPALFTADQAGAGAAVYAQACATCHGSALEGTAAPALKGQSFADLAAAQSLTADMLLDVISSTMPQSDPGSMKPDEYAAVTAYILQQNGYPTGSTALAKGAPAIKAVKITP